MSLGLTLALDGSTYAGSVAVIRDRTVIAEAQLADSGIPGRGGRDENFFPMVAHALDAAGVKPYQLDRVVCGAGPGSFTSLRVAASIAKGIAVGSNRDLFSVSSLLLMVAGAEPGRYLPTLPAMRGELFAQVIDISTNSITVEGSPALVADADVAELAKSAGAVMVSASGRSHDSSVLTRTPHARATAHVLTLVIDRGRCDIDTWEPLYGRLAEAQVKWEAAHGRPLSTG